MDDDAEWAPHPKRGAGFGLRPTVEEVRLARTRLVAVADLSQNVTLPRRDRDSLAN